MRTLLKDLSVSVTLLSRILCFTHYIKNKRERGEGIDCRLMT